MSLFALAATLIVLLCSAPSDAREMVTVDNFVRAETDMTFARYAEQGAFGKFLHIRQQTPIDRHVVRMYQPREEIIKGSSIFPKAQPFE